MEYVYAGNEGFIGAVESRLGAAGHRRVHDVAFADAVLTYCTSQTVLEDVYFDANGFVQSAKPGTLLVDLSASTPNFARELSAVAMVSDLTFVEAPLVVNDMMRADAFADAQNLRCYVAGDEGDVARAHVLLDPLVGSVIETGSTGTAQLAHAAHTIQVAAQVVAAVEADALCRALGRTSFGSAAVAARPWVLTAAAQSVVDAVEIGAFTGTYTVEMFMAELSATLMTADDVDLILPQAEAAMHLLELLAVIGGIHKAPSSLALVYAEEKECAAHGLDWTRAEHAFEEIDSEFGDCGCGCGHDHGRDHDDDDFDMFDDFDYRDN